MLVPLKPTTIAIAIAMTPLIAAPIQNPIWFLVCAIDAISDRDIANGTVNAAPCSLSADVTSSMTMVESVTENRRA